MVDGCVVVRYPCELRWSEKVESLGQEPDIFVEISQKTFKLGCKSYMAS